MPCSKLKEHTSLINHDEIQPDQKSNHNGGKSSRIITSFGGILTWVMVAIEEEGVTSKFTKSLTPVISLKTKKNQYSNLFQEQPAITKIIPVVYCNNY